MCVCGRGRGVQIDAFFCSERTAVLKEAPLSASVDLSSVTTPPDFSPHPPPHHTHTLAARSILIGYYSGFTKMPLESHILQRGSGSHFGISEAALNYDPQPVQPKKPALQLVSLGVEWSL